MFPTCVLSNTKTKRCFLDQLSGGNKYFDLRNGSKPVKKKKNWTRFRPRKRGTKMQIQRQGKRRGWFSANYIIKSLPQFQAVQMIKSSTRFPLIIRAQNSRGLVQLLDSLVSQRSQFNRYKTTAREKKNFFF